MDMNKVLGNMNEAELSTLQKAAEVLATNTFSPETRSVFAPENLDARVKLTVPTATPLRNRFARVSGYGQAAAWKRLTSKLHRLSGHAGLGTQTSVAFADAGTPNETAQTYTVTSAAYKLLGRKIDLGGMYIAASKHREGGIPDAFEHRLNIKMVETMIGEEEMIIGGNATSNTLEFDGLATQITTYSGTSSLLTVSGVNLYAGSIYDEGGSPTLLVANRRQTQGLADQLQGTGSIQRIMIDNQGNGLGGLRLTKIVNSIDGGVIDVVTSRYVGGLAFLLTERDDSGENMIEMDDLIPMSRVDVPSTTFSTTAFVVEATVLKVIAEPWQYKISGLAVA